MKEFTKQQIFNLQFKWSDIKPKYYINGDKRIKEWWNYEEYWTNISEYVKPLPVDFIREFKDYVNWYLIGMCQKLSEEFMREFSYYLCWYDLPMYQKLSENLIKENKDTINWYRVQQYQDLSEEFLYEFKDKIDWFCYLHGRSNRTQLSEEMLKKLIDEGYIRDEEFFN